MVEHLARTELRHGWTLRETDNLTVEEIPVKEVPTVVHLDLIQAQKIPDPFIGFNELDVEWVGERPWTYTTKFQQPITKDGARVDLVFEGLDTFAEVKVNGETVLKSDNMFMSYRCDITKLLRSGADNDLQIDFASALLRGREIEKQHPEYRFICHNGETGRLGVRKAQYHWGWDWGPVLMTAGPWRPVWIETYHGRIADVWSDIKPSKDFKSATGKVFVRVEGPAKSVALRMNLAGNTILEQTIQVNDHGLATATVTIDDPSLWFPHGYGDQPLYQINVRLLGGETVLDEVNKKVGIREAELVQEIDDAGKSFYLRINGVDVFAGGSCWIPADNFLPRITHEKYRNWLQLMVEGGQVMTRVWGGGIYEDDAFYDICDELGILVWQDFMFACGSYPTWPELLESVKLEAVCNLRRLRHHPSIVIYAGNNEDYQIQEQYNLDYDRYNKDTKSWLRSTFPARYIYEELLPSVVGEECPNVPYWPASPFSGGANSADLTVGDVHQWNVWHGKQEKYQVYEQIGGRFNSEFGLEAFPVMKTIEGFVKDKSDLHPRSAVMDFHNKADGHERRIGLYLAENFRPTNSMTSYAYITQVSQSEAMYFAYKPWRRQWGENRRCGGALVWQLNDCWPCTSWALVDYHLRKKPAFYTVSRLLAPIAVGVQRQHHDWSVCHARPAITLQWKLWIVSTKLTPVEASVELRFISVETGKDIKPAVKKDCTIVPNGTTNVVEGVVHNREEEPHILAARVFVNGTCIARDTDWPQPLKYLTFGDRRLKVTQNENEIQISTEKPVKALVFEEADGVKLSDNCLDLVPGDDQVIKVEGKNLQGKLSWTYLGYEE
ncbi:beta-mannosidase [Capronia epimyces CBS 606.96]|uniref:Beta-mannosidase B n=1 Tax=Capronia epimyces CBS 606.96 TaxID=1182542 RepID=W9YVE0_9EURO|nr:beta-mannosidase [Capronia epimyces CBS 606.96]EXJ93241.1 beta-mannosidase [Capronia epimyces CBS 606.96]